MSSERISGSRRYERPPGRASNSSNISRHVTADRGPRTPMRMISLNGRQVWSCAKRLGSWERCVLLMHPSGHRTLWRCPRRVWVLRLAFWFLIPTGIPCGSSTAPTRRQSDGVPQEDYKGSTEWPDRLVRRPERRTPTPRGGCITRTQLEALGPVSLRAPVGDGAGRLLRGRRVLGLLPPRSRAQPCLSLGGGRPPRNLRPAVPAGIRARSL